MLEEEKNIFTNYGAHWHWRDSQSRENLERKWSTFFISTWRIEFSLIDMFLKVKILKNSLSLLEIQNFEREKITFSSRFFPQFIFQFPWEIIFFCLGWFWLVVFCRKGKYFKKTVLWGGWRRGCQGVWYGWRLRGGGVENRDWIYVVFDIGLNIME